LTGALLPGFTPVFASASLQRYYSTFLFFALISVDKLSVFYWKKNPE
jgi:hypothetical protein